MVDRLTRVEQQGFFSRLANSVVGILIGFCMIPGSVALVGWNEYRTVHRSKGLAEAEEVVAEAPDAFEILPTLNERLVHVTGTATTDEILSDPDFGIAMKALRMEREVEMFQWVERKDSKTRDKIGGGRETITTYEYDRKWHAGRVNSDQFEEKSGHANPMLRYAEFSKVTDRPTLGVFRLRSDLVESKMNSWKDIPLDEATLLSNFDATSRQHFKVDAERMYYSAAIPDPTTPQLGDLRMRFRVVEPSSVSVLSKQEKENLVAFKTSNGETVEHLEMGNVSAADMFKSLRFENSLWAWILRLFGWVLACVGFGLIIGPLRTLASVIPLLGRLVGGLTFVISVVLGSVMTVVVIAVSWIAVRPLFGTTLLVIVAVAVYLLNKRSSPRASFATAGPATSPSSDQYSSQRNGPGTEGYAPPPVPPPLPSNPDQFRE